jgi:uncharacterized protein (DUF1499 family)
VGVALVLLALAPLGWRLGWWGFGFALFSIIPASGLAAGAAFAIAVATIVLVRPELGRRKLAALAAVLAVGAGVGYLPLHYDRLFRTLPPIDDIVTDTDDRPAFEATLAAREAASVDRDATPEPELSRLQKAGYPDIAPLRAALPVAGAFAAALATAKAMPGWTIMAVDRDRGRIEASARTRWFGFTDDIVIRVRADGDGSRIDMRSASRIGGHDIGVNAARVRAYGEALRRRIGQ